ncbi:hypothetical protein Pmar_PMAR000385, partial [Perkinsus marinus ATCC 50983]
MGGLLSHPDTAVNLPRPANGSFQGNVTPLSNGKYKVRIMNAGDSLHWVFGDFAYKDDANRRDDKRKCIAVPEVKEVVCEAGDRVLAHSGSGLAEIASEILQRCLNLLGSTDNMTYMVIRVETRDFGLKEQQGELQLGRYSSVHSSALDMAEKYQVFFSE